MADSRGDHRLTIQIAVAILLAIVTALLLPVFERLGVPASALLVPLQTGGEIFLRVLKMLVVPLVVASVMSGILGMGDVRNLRRPGLAAVTYFLATSLLAVLLGLAVVNLIRPGVGTVDERILGEMQREEETPRQELYQHLAGQIGVTDEKVAEILGDREYALRRNPGLAEVLKNLVLMLFTDNLFRAAANMELLPLIMFSIVFAGLLTTLGPRVRVLVDFTKQMDEVLIRFVLLLMRFAPLGAYCLVAARFGEANVEGELVGELAKMGGFTLTVLLGLGLHLLVALPLIVSLFTGRNPYRYMLQMTRALLTGFSTGSSSATLPVTMECAAEAGVSKRSVDFVLPLGATVNMNGTALFIAVAAIFIAQVTTDGLSWGQQLIVAVTAVLAAVGAAGIPQAGLVTLIIVLTSVGLQAEYITLILSVDWLLDRFRTVVNVFGDACGAAVVERTFPPEEVERVLQGST